MKIKNLSDSLLYYFLFSILFLISCKSKAGSNVAETPQEMQEKTPDLIKKYIGDAINHGSLSDTSIKIKYPEIAKLLYEKNDYSSLWCNKELWLPEGDSLFSFIETSKLFGLLPQDYHFGNLYMIRQKFFMDTLAVNDRKDVSLWAKADILFTDAFINIIHDIKLGRLPNDSITLRKDSVLQNDFYLQQFDALKETELSALVKSLEPSHKGYLLLKEGIIRFLDSADYRVFTKVPYTTGNLKKFNSALQKRLFEEGYITFNNVEADSLQLAKAIKVFQKKNGIAVDGKAGEGTIRKLNENDTEKFYRIAISMDKYKMLPEKMPEKYIWVNACSNYLEVIENDTVKLISKVITGRPKTRTPVLTSTISQLITYPQWTIPQSIIIKEILPAVKRNPGYLLRKGFSVVDSKGNELDPYSINWAKYSKGIPYRIVQGSGDANALGIMKFQFDNKYSVYLHDTNQRYLFSNATRSLSHGCVRVQQWEKLTYYILKNDSLSEGPGYSKIDSVKTWLQNKEKKIVALKNKLPVFIRYFTCQGVNGRIVFYDDIYGEDKWLREKYFAGK